MFTNDEIDLISESLDALKSKAGMDHIMVGMFSAVLAPKDASKEILDEQKAEFDAKEDERRLLEDRIIMLRAKLIQLRDKNLITDVVSNIE